MDFFLDEQAIVACSTSLASSSAIALIRISGFVNIVDLQDFFSFDLSKVQARKSHLSSILYNGSKLDECLLVFFPGPKSYTGENILELSVHGNPLSVQLILDAFCSSKKMRLAREGEFTYRALINKKMNLSQVEGLDLILNAQSAQVFSQGLSLMHGELHTEYLKLHSVFLLLKASVELSIDFLEDIGEDQAEKQLQFHLAQFHNLISSLHARTQSSSSDLLNPSIVLVGQVNAGKSSLFNALLKNKRSIVSPVAGTTRDFITEYTLIKGINFKLVDTAGLRITQDPIEHEGIERALGIFQHAFFRVLVINPFDTNDLDFEPLFTHFKKEELDLIVLTHSDCLFFEEAWAKHSSLFPVSVPKLKVAFGPIEPASFICDTGSGGSIEPLLNLALNKFIHFYQQNPILIERHRDVINKIFLQTKCLLDLLNSTSDIAIIASQINTISTALEELIGVVSTHEVLDSIFSRFCIGK